jgi:Flp pilus assembly protein TadG
MGGPEIFPRRSNRTGIMSLSLSLFLQDRRGAIAPIFAIALVPLIGLTGAAIDYGRANLDRTAMQAALDATALTLSKDVSGLTSSQITQKASDYFNANFNRPDAQGIAVNATYTAASSTLTVSGSGSIPTTFMKVMGISTIAISSSATVTWGTTKLRVAFALDNTGSMAANNKIGALKTATHQLLTTLQGLATNAGDVQVAIVPFAKDVTVDTGNDTATWIDWTRWEAEPPGLATKPGSWSSAGPGSTCPITDSNYGVHCTTGPVNGSSSASTIPSSGAYKGYICPSVDSGSKDAQNLGRYYNGCYDTSTYTCTGAACVCTGHASCTCTGSGASMVCKQPAGTFEHAWRPTGTVAAPAHSTWNGCITDRGDPANDSAPSTQNTDQLVTTPSTGTPATLFPADQYLYCDTEMLGMSYNWSALSALVDAMQPNGSTDQPIGLVWAWQALTTGAPLNSPAVTDTTTKQILILLSDGLNTQDRWYGDGSDTSTQVDSRMYIASGGTCANIKNAGVVIYTIQVNVNSADPTSTVMKNCASTPANFFMLTTSGQIIDTFATIGTQLTQLHLSQ